MVKTTAYNKQKNLKQINVSEPHQRGCQMFRAS